METEELFRTRLHDELAQTNAPPMPSGIAGRAIGGGTRRLRRRRWARAAGGVAAVAVLAGGATVASGLGPGDSVAVSGPQSTPSTPGTPSGRTEDVVPSLAAPNPDHSPLSQRISDQLARLAAQNALPGEQTVTTVSATHVEAGFTRHSGDLELAVSARMEKRDLIECRIPNANESRTDPVTGIVTTTECSDAGGPAATITKRLPGDTTPFAAQVIVRVDGELLMLTFRTDGSGSTGGPALPVPLDLIKSMAGDAGWLPIAQAHQS